jgi:hypothetical protein
MDDEVVNQSGNVTCAFHCECKLCLTENILLISLGKLRIFMGRLEYIPSGCVVGDMTIS